LSLPCEVQQLHAAPHSAGAGLHNPVYACQKVTYSHTTKVDLQLASAPYYKRNTDIPEYCNPKRDRISPTVNQGPSPAIFSLGNGEQLAHCVHHLELSRF